MSFWPFPKTLLDELRAALSRGPGVELGSGTGQLHDRLAASGLRVMTADLTSPADVRLDATRLPFPSGRFGLVVAGNLLRHLPGGSRREMLVESARILRSGGRLLLLEDDPGARSKAEANYRTALDLLARADAARGPAVDLSTLLEDRPAELEDLIWSGTLDNEEPLDNPLAPADWLDAHAAIPARELAAHRAEVVEYGMEYGRFQAHLLQRAPRTEGD